MSVLKIKEKTKNIPYSPYEDMLTYLHQAAQITGLSESTRRKLGSPEKQILLLNFMITMDNGRERNFEGFYVIHSTVSGPARGGILFAPDISLNTIKALAASMTWKSALAGIPFGGAKGGVLCDPGRLSAKELERLTQSYIQALSDVFRRNREFPGTQVIDWLKDEFSLLHGKSIATVLGGRKLPSDQTAGRIPATGRGISTATLLAANSSRLEPQHTTVAIQGFGNVGLHTARHLYEKKFKIQAVGDIQATYYNPEGLDINHLIAYSRQHNHSIAGYPRALAIPNGQLLSLDVDILIPAARGHVIREDNADQVKARIIIEAANGPVSPAADKILRDKGVVVIPDILANAGGMIVSYLEWLQNNLHERWDPARVQARMEEMITASFTEVSRTADRRRVSLRTAAYILALSRIAEDQQLSDKLGWGG